MNKTLALRYAGFALLGAALVKLGWPWSAPSLWLVAGWSCLAAGYAGVGSCVWGKSSGPALRVCLWPVQQFLHLNHARQRPSDDAPIEIAPGLWFGGRLTQQEAERWLPKNVAVLDVAPEYAAAWGEKQTAYMNLNILEGTAPPALDLLIAQLFVDMNRENGVFIHGAQGNSRSAMVAAAWLLRQYPRMTIDQALVVLRTARKQVSFNAAQTLVLQQLKLLLQQDEKSPAARLR